MNSHQSDVIMRAINAQMSYLVEEETGAARSLERLRQHEIRIAEINADIKLLYEGLNEE